MKLLLCQLPPVKRTELAIREGRRRLVEKQ